MDPALLHAPVEMHVGATGEGGGPQCGGHHGAESSPVNEDDEITVLFHGRFGEYGVQSSPSPAAADAAPPQPTTLLPTTDDDVYIVYEKWPEKLLEALVQPKLEPSWTSSSPPERHQGVEDAVSPAVHQEVEPPGPPPPLPLYPPPPVPPPPPSEDENPGGVMASSSECAPPLTVDVQPPMPPIRKRNEKTDTTQIDDLFRRTKTKPTLYWLPNRSSEVEAIAREHQAENTRSQTAEDVALPVAGVASAVEETSVLVQNATSSEQAFASPLETVPLLCEDATEPVKLEGDISVQEVDMSIQEVPFSAEDVAVAVEETILFAEQVILPPAVGDVTSASAAAAVEVPEPADHGVVGVVTEKITVLAKEVGLSASDKEGIAMSTSDVQDVTMSVIDGKVVAVPINDAEDVAKPAVSEVADSANGPLSVSDISSSEGDDLDDTTRLVIDTSSSEEGSAMSCEDEDDMCSMITQLREDDVCSTATEMPEDINQDMKMGAFDLISSPQDLSDEPMAPSCSPSFASPNLAVVKREEDEFAAPLPAGNLSTLRGRTGDREALASHDGASTAAPPTSISGSASTAPPVSNTTSAQPTASVGAATLAVNLPPPAKLLRAAHPMPIALIASKSVRCTAKGSFSDKKKLLDKASAPSGSSSKLLTTASKQLTRSVQSVSPVAKLPHLANVCPIVKTEVLPPEGSDSSTATPEASGFSNGPVDSSAATLATATSTSVPEQPTHSSAAPPGTTNSSAAASAATPAACGSSPAKAAEAAALPLGWCTVCGGAQASWEAFVAHFLARHALRGDRDAYCELCLARRPPGPTGMQPHQNSHRAVSVSCPLCAARFLRQVNLLEHLAGFHRTTPGAVAVSQAAEVTLLPSAGLASVTPPRKGGSPTTARHGSTPISTPEKVSFAVSNSSSTSGSTVNPPMSFSAQESGFLWSEFLQGGSTAPFDLRARLADAAAARARASTPSTSTPIKTAVNMEAFSAAFKAVTEAGTDSLKRPSDDLMSQAASKLSSSQLNVDTTQVAPNTSRVAFKRPSETVAPLARKKLFVVASSTTTEAVAKAATIAAVSTAAASNPAVVAVPKTRTTTAASKPALLAAVSKIASTATAKPALLAATPKTSTTRDSSKATLVAVSKTASTDISKLAVSNPALVITVPKIPTTTAVSKLVPGAVSKTATVALSKATTMMAVSKQTMATMTASETDAALAVLRGRPQGSPVGAPKTESPGSILRGAAGASISTSLTPTKRSASTSSSSSSSEASDVALSSDSVPVLASRQAVAAPTPQPSRPSVFSTKVLGRCHLPACKDAPFNDWEDYADHYEQRHTYQDPKKAYKDRRKACPKCVGTFNSMEDLTDHVVRVHENPRFSPRRCLLCPAEFREQRRLDNHMRDFHRQE